MTPEQYVGVGFLVLGWVFLFPAARKAGIRDGWRDEHAGLVFLMAGIVSWNLLSLALISGGIKL